MGATTGLVSHYFPTKRALIAHARLVAEMRTATMDRSVGHTPGYESLRAMILDGLPLTPQKVALNRAWVSFWDAAIGDTELHQSETVRYEKWRTRLQEHIAVAQTRSELFSNVPAEDLSVMIASFAHGLVVQALFDTTRFTPKRQTQFVDQFLATLKPHDNNQRSSPSPVD